MAPSQSVARLDRQSDRIRTGAHAERGKNGSTVHLHRPLTKAQFIGDLLVELACGELQKHLSLARGECYYAIMGGLATFIICTGYVFCNFYLRTQEKFEITCRIEYRRDHHGIAERCASLSRRNDAWWLVGKLAEVGPFDAAILAIPAEQAAPILSLQDLAMGQSALVARSQPCWTGMFAFDRPLTGLPPVFRSAGPIAWAARNSAKPSRTGPEAWIVQASPSWSGDLLEAPAEHVAAMLQAELAKAAGMPIPQPISATAHRWRYAISAGTGDGALWNPSIRLGACGDWLLGPRVEHAWLSGRILAGRCADLGLHDSRRLA